MNDIVYILVTDRHFLDNDFYLLFSDRDFYLLFSDRDFICYFQIRNLFAIFSLQYQAGPNFRIWISNWIMTNFIGENTMKPSALVGLGEMGWVISFTSAQFSLFFIYFKVNF